ncbi:3-deoxy-manno-octulosonate-8-phosphatase KdsC [uncultured Thiodictyon sp.]|uniref:3-deoxy-manno-octulosonate-8-phosphatase KdsC n=1 Tax=uncultured Thiodictyon sp. TaxID=1846217 RepID=UPI0025D98FE4|nr:3-deoxy-manno-octulosonate-8-phosphatase KdsC [uncultured Thiodictyon sp.]
MQDILERAARVRLVIFDVDGVLTDARLYLGDHGQELKVFNARDGHGMVMLRETGVALAVISGRQSAVVHTRMQDLGVTHVYQGQRDKLPAYEELIRTLGLTDEVIAYLGDDVIDLPVMRRVGLAIAVADAHPVVRRYAHWCTAAPGGRGAARELCELVMEAQGTLEPMISRYL